jgi:hypothetical protein
MRLSLCSLGIGIVLLLDWSCGGSSSLRVVDADADSSADGAESCQELMTDYMRAEGPAVACTPGAANQCQQTTLPLNCTGCYQSVQDATTLDALRAQMLAQGCIHPVACPCISSGNNCTATDGGSASGVCGG